MTAAPSAQTTGCGLPPHEADDAGHRGEQEDDHDARADDRRQQSRTESRTSRPLPARPGQARSWRSITSAWRPSGTTIADRHQQPTDEGGTDQRQRAQARARRCRAPRRRHAAASTPPSATSCSAVGLERRRDPVEEERDHDPGNDERGEQPGPCAHPLGHAVSSRPSAAATTAATSSGSDEPERVQLRHHREPGEHARQHVRRRGRASAPRARARTRTRGRARRARRRAELDRHRRQSRRGQPEEPGREPPRPVAEQPRAKSRNASTAPSEVGGDREAAEDAARGVEVEQRSSST